jgi:hypothetical protein
MKTYSFIIAFAGILLTPLVHASDPIAIKKNQFIQKQLMLQNRIPPQAQKTVQKVAQPQLKPVKVALQTQNKQQAPVQQTPAQQPQKQKIDLSSFAIRPMQAWKEELKVPTTSNDGIEILPHAVN